MKSKLFRILGVVAVVAMLASALVASPVSAATAVSAVTVTTTSAGGVISATGNYSIYATLTTQLVATKSATLTFAASPNAATFASVTAYDQVALTVTGTGSSVTVTGATSGNGTFTTAGTATDVITYAAGLQTATVTANAASTVAYKLLGPVSVALGAGVTSGTVSTTADTLTVTFPSTFGVTGTVTGTIASSAGWVTGLNTTAQNVAAYVTGIGSPTSSTTANTVTFTLAAGDYIGANSQILINITAGVTNPATAGSYTLTVATLEDATPVTSNTFAIVNPTPASVAGVASVYNTAATPILINQFNSLDSALEAAIAVAGGATIKLTAGTYTDSSTILTADSPYTFTGTNVITIQGTDPSPANVIIKEGAAWQISGSTIVIDSVTIDGTNGSLTVAPSKAGTVSNSTITKNALIFNATGTGTSTASKDTFTVKTGKTGLIPTTATTVTGCTFTVQGAGYGIGGTATGDVTVSGSTFTGAADSSTPIVSTLTGYGINLTTGTASGTGSTIGTSTFTGLSTAIAINTIGDNVTITGNTFTACGVTASGGVNDAIMFNGVASATPMVYVLNNTISNSPEYFLVVANSLDNQITVNENQFSGNTKNIKDGTNQTTGTPLNATHNYWGGAANNPADVTTAPLISYGNTLGAAPSAATSVSGTALTKLDATVAAGVNISGVTAAATQLGAAALKANPVAVAVPSQYTVIKYFDVFGIGVTNATIDFYGTTAAPVVSSSTMSTSVLFFNSTTGTWQACSVQSVNAYGNYVEVSIAGATNTPTNTQFAGLPFVLVTTPVTLGAPGTTTYPTNGATSVPVSPTNVTFTWPVVTGTGITYQFALAQASANTTANEFAILDYSDNTITNAEPLQETLQYNTVYWWEVRAVSLNSSGAVAATGPWTVSMFTTAAAPVTTTGGTGTVVTTVVTSVVITNPVTTVVSTSTNIVLPSNTGTSSPAIPSYLLWAVIAVGAVLIIAVIVLIVRTRRIP